YSLADIGGNVGFFVFKAAEKGCSAWCIEGDLPSVMMGEYVRQRSSLVDAHFIRWFIDKDNIHRLPSFDYVLLLSVFHHWCAAWGYDAAKEMLRVLVSKTKKRLFFEMGHAEMPAKYNIPS